MQSMLSSETAWQGETGEAHQRRFPAAIASNHGENGHDGLQRAKTAPGTLPESFLVISWRPFLKMTGNRSRTPIYGLSGSSSIPRSPNTRSAGSFTAWHGVCRHSSGDLLQEQRHADAPCDFKCACSHTRVQRAIRLQHTKRSGSN